MWLNFWKIVLGVLWSQSLNFLDRQMHEKVGFCRFFNSRYRGRERDTKSLPSHELLLRKGCFFSLYFPPAFSSQRSQNCIWENWELIFLLLIMSPDRVIHGDRHTESDVDENFPCCSGHLIRWCPLWMEMFRTIKDVMGLLACFLWNLGSLFGNIFSLGFSYFT